MPTSVNANYNSCSDGSGACCVETGCKCNCAQTCVGWLCTISCDPCSGCSGNPDPVCGGDPPPDAPTNTPTPPGCVIPKDPGCPWCGWNPCTGTCDYTCDDPTPPPPVTTIKGYKSLMPGNVYDIATKVSAMEILRDDANPTTDNPYSYAGLSPGSYKISAAQPDVNYLVGYTKCDNAENCHDGSQPYTFIPQTMPVTPASVTFSAPESSVSLWWHYWEYVGWYRFKNVSFHKQEGIQNFIPLDVVPYDGFDTNEEYLNIREPALDEGVGIITARNAIDLGPNIPNVSQKNWSKSQYDVRDKGYLADLESYLRYTKARKNFQVITTLDEVQSDRINVFENDIAITDYNFMSGKKNVVLLVNGNVLIDFPGGGVFNDPAGGRESIAIISTGTISIAPDMTEVGAILIANNFDLAEGAVTSQVPLKIAGNLISNTPITDLKRYRPADEYQQASLYVVFLSKFYVDLMPQLSTINLEGREIQ